MSALSFLSQSFLVILYSFMHWDKYAVCVEMYKYASRQQFMSAVFLVMLYTYSLTGFSHIIFEL